MSTMTLEQIERVIQGFAGYSATHHGIGGELLTAASEYAALLRERESAKPVAWLDMGKGEAQLVFSKKGDSNRASRKHAGRLFETIGEGYHPLYLHPPMLASESSEELKEWEEFGRQIEKRLRYNPWGFKGSYPEIIDQVMKLASVRVPDGWSIGETKVTGAQEIGVWLCDGKSLQVIHPGDLMAANLPFYLIKAMLATAPNPETED